MQTTVLLPLKKRLEKADMEVLAADRVALEGILRAIMSDKRLAMLIVRAWCAENEMEMIPEGYLDEYRFPYGRQKTSTHDLLT